MKILAMSTSPSEKSINRILVDAAIVEVKEQLDKAAVEHLDLRDYMLPLYTEDLERADGVPQAAHDLLAAIGAADALILAFPEHNGNYTAAWKNTFDWMSRIEAKVYQGKPAVVMSASPGARGGATVLSIVTASAPYFGLDVRSQVSVGSFYEGYDQASGQLTRATDREAITAAVASLR